VPCSLPDIFFNQFQVIALLATLTASSLATPVSLLDHYSPLKVAVSHPAVAIAHHVPVAHHETVEVEHYVSAARESAEPPY
jgi:ABC-type Co2+ transport system permease subunit